MAIIDDIREVYVQILDVADFSRAEFPDEFGMGLAEAYTRSAAVLKEILNKYEPEYLNHEPLT